jgi:hypothetical protein
MDLMNRAIDQTDLPADVSAVMRGFLAQVATFMINRR